MVERTFPSTPVRSNRATTPLGVRAFLASRDAFSIPPRKSRKAKIEKKFPPTTGLELTQCQVRQQPPTQRAIKRRLGFAV
jgi:hypothetical protein